VGNRGATDILLGGLKRLEYRGYDSAGLVMVEDRALHILKGTGKVRDLEQTVYAKWDAEFRERARVGIAHTRWATHGSPTAENAHPHLDQTGHIAMVHNGIIENYVALRAQLKAKGHTFHSQTDSEVLIHLIGELYKGNLAEAVCAALKHVEGTYGIAVVSVNEPDKIVVAR
jgi:glucosamine--fructose-6-phosphate aminotransferase (isomerizing)